MNNELLLLNKKYTDTLVEQTETRPQEALEFNMNKQMQTFSFSPPLDLVEESKWVLGVTSFDCTSSAFNTANEKDSFAISTPGYWFSRGDAELINKLQKLLKLRSQNVIKLQVEGVRKRGSKIKIVGNEDKLSDLDTHKNEIFKELKNLEYNDLEDMVFRRELTYHEFAKILDTKYIDAKSVGYCRDLLLG